MEELMLTIRKMKTHDAKRVLAAFNEIVADSKWLLTGPGEGPKNVKEERAFIRSHLKSKNSILALAEMNGEVIGFAGGEGGKKNRNTHVVLIGLAIRKQWRGKGVGKTLMKYLLSWAKRIGIVKLRLNVIENNKIAYNLYRKMGFIKEGYFRREIRIGRRYYNTIEMAKFVR